MVHSSIVIPTRNSAKTVSRALESVLNQTYADFEILIVDNCSEDDTVTIAKTYNDKRIKIFSGKDKGVYDAMNKSLQYAIGEWLYFLGSDDNLYDKTVLEDVFGFIDENNCDVVYGNVVSERCGGAYGEAFDADKLLHQNICHQALFLHKTVFDKAGKFNLRYKTQADWDHNMRWFFARNIRHCYINRIIAVYNDGGLSAAGDPVFEQHRIARYVQHAGNKLPLKRRLQLLKYAFDKARSEKQAELSRFIFFTGIKALFTI